MNKVREYVENLPDEEKELIMLGYDKLEKEGAIGEEPIRLHAEALVKSLGMDRETAHIVMWMEKLDHECCRHFTRKYFQGRL